MSPRNLVWFYVRRVRARLVQETFAAVGIAIGVALLFAVLVSSRSLSASIAQLTDGLVGHAQHQVVARGPHGFDERLLTRIGSIPGVEAAAPVLQMQANVVGPGGHRVVTLLGADARLAELGGTLLHGWSGGRLAQLQALVLPTSVARPLGVRFGQTVTLEVAGRVRQVTVGAVVGHDDVGPLAETPAVVAPLQLGQQLTGMDGRVSRVFVRAAPDRADAVKRALESLAAGRLDVRPADSEARLFAEAAFPANQSAELFAGISALVGFLFALNAMLLMTRERRRLIAELRMSGYGLRAVLQVVVFDAVVLGVVASLMGVGLGELLSLHVFHPSPGYLSIAFPVGNGRTVQATTIILAVAAGMLAAVLATFVPLAAALRAQALDEVQDDGLDERSGRIGQKRWWLFIGSAACLAITTAILVFAPGSAQLGMGTLVGSMLLTLPVVLTSVLGFAYRLRRRFKSVVPMLAVGELLSAGNRSVGIAAIAAIAVFGSTAIEGAHRDLQRGLDPNAAELNRVAPVWVTPRGVSDTLPTTPFDPAPAIRALARDPSVRAVQVYRGSFLDVGDRRSWVIAPPRGARDPIPPTQVITGSVGHATALLRSGGWFVASQAIATALGAHVGDAITLQSPRPTRLRLAAITTNFGWSPGTLVLNADDYARAWATMDASALQVALMPGVSAQAGLRAVQHALSGQAALAAHTARQREDAARATTRDGLSRLTHIATLVLLAAAFAMAAAMGGMVWQRRRRLADLKLTGIGSRALWHGLLLESAILLGVGCTVGALYGLYGEQLLGRALNTVTGFPVAHSIGATVALGSLALVTLVAGLIAALPGYLAARIPAEAAFRD
ncbi:MAG: ABC transporter permease [Actinobacteria bacterium]|nr:ABC transporter permease [Actinomycetota bacterium]